MAQQPPKSTGGSNQPNSHSGPTTAAGQRAMQNAAKARAKGHGGGKPKPTTGGTGAKVPPPAKTGGSKGTTPAPAPAATPPAPFLTPAQQMALNNWNTTYAEKIANLEQGDIGAVTKFNEGVSADTQRNTQQVDTTNQSMAARGMFTSSIRAGALNDLATTLQQQLNVLQTNEHATLLANQTAINSLGSQNANQQAYYDSLSVENAQALPVSPPPPAAPPPPPPPPPAASAPHPNPNGNGTSTGATSTGGTGAPYVASQAQPAGTRPPRITGQSNQPNSHSGPTGAGLHIHAPGITGAARVRAGIGGPRVPGTGTIRGGG